MGGGREGAVGRGLLFCLFCIFGAASGFAQRERFKFEPKDSVQQQEYQEFLAATKAERELADSLGYLEAEKFFDFNADEEKLAPYKAQHEAAARQREAAFTRFLYQHPAYAVSAALVKHRFYQDFTFTAEEYDDMAEAVQQCPDTSYTNFINRNLKIAKKYTLGVQYTDFKAPSLPSPIGEEGHPDGTPPLLGEVGKELLSSLMQPGKYTLVDFWASWCGPCRSAIPKVKAMSEQFADKLQVVSVSLDQKEADWLQAVEKEAMPWPQLWLTGEDYDRVLQAYMINSIPRLVLIAPDGGIQLATFDPTAIRKRLEQVYTVRATVPDVRKGTEVKLEAASGNHHDVAQTLCDDGGFTLYGTIDRPTYVTMKLYNKPKGEYAEGEYPEDRGLTFCLSPGDEVSISAVCYDSIPKNYEYMGTPLLKEKNVSVTGGTVQQHFQQWRDYIFDTELAAWRANFAWRNAEFGIKAERNAKLAAKLKPAMLEAERRQREANRRFISEHPTYSVSLWLQQQQMGDMFRYTDQQLDQMLTLLAGNEDSLRYADFQQTVAGLRKYTCGQAYTDLDVQTPDGTLCHLSDYIVKGKLNLIDFWASWCGPCRAAIPQVKEMAKAHSKKLNVISVSLDKDQSAWQKAMEQEQMPWQQLLVPQSAMKAMVDAYRVTAIPYLLLIDETGRIRLSTHTPDEVF